MARGGLLLFFVLPAHAGRDVLGFLKRRRCALQEKNRETGVGHLVGQALLGRGALPRAVGVLQTNQVLGAFLVPAVAAELGEVRDRADALEAIEIVIVPERRPAGVLVD